MQRPNRRWALLVLPLLIAATTVAGVGLARMTRPGQDPSGGQSPTAIPAPRLTRTPNLRIEAFRLIEARRFEEAEMLLQSVESAPPDLIDVPDAKRLRAMSWIAQGFPGTAEADLLEAHAIVEKMGGYTSARPGYFATIELDLAQLYLNHLDDGHAAAERYGSVWKARAVISARDAHIAATQRAFALARVGRQVEAEAQAVELLAFHAGDTRLGMPAAEALAFHLSRTWWFRDSRNLVAEQALLYSLWSDPHFADQPLRIEVGVTLAGTLPIGTHGAERAALASDVTALLRGVGARPDPALLWSAEDKALWRDQLSVLIRDTGGAGERAAIEAVGTGRE